MDKRKFRVWDTEANGWYIDCTMGQTGELMCSDIDDYGMPTSTPLCLTNRDDDRYLPEQCLGRCDRNGRLIYEGDIVNLLPIDDEYHKNRIVKWEGDSWTTVKTVDGFLSCCAVGFHEVEIIGNIHEGLFTEQPTDNAAELRKFLDELDSDIRHLLQSKNPDMGSRILAKINAMQKKARGEE